MFCAHLGPNMAEEQPPNWLPDCLPQKMVYANLVPKMRVVHQFCALHNYELWTGMSTEQFAALMYCCFRLMTQCVDTGNSTPLLWCLVWYLVTILLERHIPEDNTNLDLAHETIKKFVFDTICEFFDMEHQTKERLHSVINSVDTCTISRNLPLQKISSSEFFDLNFFVKTSAFVFDLRPATMVVFLYTMCGAIQDRSLLNMCLKATTKLVLRTSCAHKSVLDEVNTIFEQYNLYLKGEFLQQLLSILIQDQNPEAYYLQKLHESTCNMMSRLLRNEVANQRDIMNVEHTDDAAKDPPRSDQVRQGQVRQRSSASAKRLVTSLM